ncbi:hypothetical protein MMC25_005843 [Agyrium rufum]|nr:hypothetical protein [Agyrium rufum]
MSLRAVARAASRNIPRTFARTSTRILIAPLPTTSLRQTWPTTQRSLCAAFSTSSTFREMAGEVDVELSSKLESELNMEKDMRDIEKLPETIQDFLDNSAFELHDTPGQEEVTLTRSFGEEKIKITFSIADLNAMDEDPDRFGEDKALYDEDTTELSETQSGGAQSKNTINQGQTRGANFNVAPEDSEAPADRPELQDDESADAGEDQVATSFPATLNITIEKPGAQGVLQLETVATDGVIVIENAYYFPSADLADAKTAEQDWTKRGIYAGPEFGNLDQELQVLLERYLDERGINTALALWVPEYIDFKEQREYIEWLSKVKSFIDA